jgi:hypothetical protein
VAKVSFPLHVVVQIDRSSDIDADFPGHCSTALIYASMYIDRIRGSYSAACVRRQVQSWLLGCEMHVVVPTAAVSAAMQNFPRLPWHARHHFIKTQLQSSSDRWSPVGYRPVACVGCGALLERSPILKIMTTRLLPNMLPAHCTFEVTQRFSFVRWRSKWSQSNSLKKHGLWHFPHCPVLAPLDCDGS